MKKEWINVLKMVADIKDGDHVVSPEELKRALGNAALAAAEGGLEYLLDNIRTAKSNGTTIHAKADVIIEDAEIAID